MSATSNFDAVRFMYDYFGIHERTTAVVPPHLVHRMVASQRVRALMEETEELATAYMTNDLPGIADALVDLVVFALGTAVMHDLPWEELFSEVMRANMGKVAGPGQKYRSSDGQVDLLKPEGWVPPHIMGVLLKRGWKPDPSVWVESGHTATYQPPLFKDPDE